MVNMDDKKLLMNLPSNLKTMIQNGTSNIYRLAKSTPQGAKFLLELSQNQTYYMSETGEVLTEAGSLDEIDVQEVVRFDQTEASYGINFSFRR